MEEIKLNDCVALKSGGPVMIVSSYGTSLRAGAGRFPSSVEDRDIVECSWFDGTARKEGKFKVGNLKKVDCPE